jgi:hypothetical protein
MPSEGSREHVTTGDVKPVLQFSLTCDGVAQDSAGKPVFIGVFTSISRLGRVPQFFVANRWVNGQGSFEQTVRLLYPDLSVFATAKPTNFRLQSRASAHDVYSGFVNLNFDRAGVYWISVELGTESVLAYPIPVFGAQPAVEQTVS